MLVTIYKKNGKGAHADLVLETQQLEVRFSKKSKEQDIIIPFSSIGEILTWLEPEPGCAPKSADFPEVLRVEMILVWRSKSQATACQLLDPAL